VFRRQLMINPSFATTMADRSRERLQRDWNGYIVYTEATSKLRLKVPLGPATIADKFLRWSRLSWALWFVETRHP
jgi:hypothetical protein